MIRGTPKTVFPRIFEEWDVGILTFEADIEPYAIKRDAEVHKIASKHKVRIITEISNTIFNPELILMKNLGRPPLTYQKFLGIVESMTVPVPLAVPVKLSNSSRPNRDTEEESIS